MSMNRLFYRFSIDKNEITFTTFKNDGLSHHSYEKCAMALANDYLLLSSLGSERNESRGALRRRARRP